MSRWDWYPKPSPRRKAEGGIKAAGKKGSFGTSWWAKRWQAVLEGFNIGARLARGRSYARSGQVLSVEIGKGEVLAQVQGSRAKPYKVVIKVAEIGRPEWERLAEALSQQVIFAARLLAGEMPEDIETVFVKEKLSLFPARSKDLTTDCSCPDWSNPCKHIAAVYYLLGAEFDRDPFLIFRLRGIERSELVAMLGAPAAVTETATETAEERAGSASVAIEPLSVEPDLFWEGEPFPDDPWGEVSIPAVSAALPKSLGRFPFWSGADSFPECQALHYVRVSQEVTERLFGE
ncbi:MAG TPA: SWIM zinc finger family protein [Geobacteraceae bacterium]|nr:SWIM zinc finger family protein [Geobacteraceae bacterium]